MLSLVLFAVALAALLFGAVCVIALIAAFLTFVKRLISGEQVTAAPNASPEHQRRTEWQRRRETENARYEAQLAREIENHCVVVEQVWAKNLSTIQKFWEIAERKVSVIDEYGDESFDQLQKCVTECLIKIGAKEGIDAKSVRKFLRTKPRSETGTETLFQTLRTRLEETFRLYHATQRSVSKPGTVVENLTGEAFEQHLARWLPRFGLTDVRGTPSTGDQGADLIARFRERVIVIQAKRYSAPVGNRAVQEAVAALRYYRGDEAWVITNSTFTKGAIALAQANRVTLVDGVALDAWKAKVR